MDIPILGTIDVTPTGLFLFFAAVIAVGYFGYQLFGTGRAGRDAKEADETSKLEAGEGAADDTEAEAVTDDADERNRD
ncbi:MAG TPA: hypothetical protein VFD20_04335 [Demequina sp.]|nr:hypothetical protein [Demequina sp.]